jgi:membrane dipeptidase
MERFTALCGLLVLTVFAGGMQAQEVSERAKKLHERAIVIDTHIDVPSEHFSEADYNVGERHDKNHVDLPRMKEGGLDAGFFSIYISANTTGPEAVKRAVRLIDWTRQQVEKNAATAALATTAAEIRNAHKQGKRAILMGMEGGHMMDDDLGVLRMYAALGIRYLTLTHTRNTNWADSSTDTAKHNGLTDFGKDVVRELNRQGVMVDLSHVADKTFYDAIEVSKAPVILSHSSCRALANVPRNVTDDMLRALVKNGGVIQITFVDSFISQELATAQDAVRDEQRKRIDEIQKQYTDNAEQRQEAMRKVREEYRARMPKVSWEKIIEHIDHAVNIAGVDHVGIGSDFDGATMPEGLEDVTRLPKITEALLRKGYKEKDIEKILGGNLLRVMERVEKVSQQMKASTAK